MSKVIKRDANLAPVLGVLNTTTGEVEEAYSEDGLEKPILVIMNYTWDSDLMVPVRMTQPLTNVDELEDVNKGIYWLSTRYQWDGNNNSIYKGVHETLNASVDSTDWQITKMTWDGSNPIYIQGPTQGAWSNRENLGW